MISTVLLTMAIQYLNVPYVWGGNNYNGLDCSGFVLKTLSDVGILLPDMTAKSIYNWAFDQKEFYETEPKADCLLFFGQNFDNISHVAIAINEKYMIESGGAGQNSLAMSPEDLARIDARVRIKPIHNRKDLLACIKITY